MVRRCVLRMSREPGGLPFLLPVHPPRRGSVSPESRRLLLSCIFMTRTV